MSPPYEPSPNCSLRRPCPFPRATAAAAATAATAAKATACRRCRFWRHSPNLPRRVQKLLPVLLRLPWHIELCELNVSKQLVLSFCFVFCFVIPCSFFCDLLSAVRAFVLYITIGCFPVDLWKLQSTFLSKYEVEISAIWFLEEKKCQGDRA